MSLHCPSCNSSNYKKNGHSHYGKQNHYCLNCGRQFVCTNNHYISSSERAKIERSLLERNSLRGICRIFEVSYNWLKEFARQVWNSVPDDLGIDAYVTDRIDSLDSKYSFGIQMDEMWSFVGSKKVKKWIWIAYDPSLQVTVACHIGGRGKEDAKKLWHKIPDNLKHFNFETDGLEAYKSIIPKNQHKVGKKYTYFIEGFNTKIRARCSRLVRKSIAFSKLEEWHEKAIMWMLWTFNLEKLNLL